jgi:hypothetical protein
MKQLCLNCVHTGAALWSAPRVKLPPFFGQVVKPRLW